MAAKAKKKSKKAAPKTHFNIKVTQKHIDEGAQDNAEDCALALASREHFEGLGFEVDSVEVDGNNLSMSLSCNFTLPKTATAFISKFDESAPSEDDFVTEKYSDGSKNPKYVAAMKKFNARVKPFAFAV